MRKWMALIGILMFGAAAVRADVKVVRSVETEAAMGLGGHPKVMTVWTGADRQREEQKSEGKPSMLEKLAGLGRPVITRLDKKVRWTINAPKKTYQESPLVVPASAAESGESEPDTSSGSPEKATTKITKAEFKVTPLGQKKKIGSYSCDGYTLRAVLETEDLESHQRSEMRMVTTFWNAPLSGDLALLKKEEEAYSQAYQKAIGMDASAKAGMSFLGTAMIASIAGAGEKDLAKTLAGVPAELKKIKGYPVQTRVEWYGRDDAQADTETADASSEDVEIPTSISDALGGLASHMAKKKMESKKPAATADGRLMFAMTTQIQSIETGTLPADVFEVPTGFKKVK